MEKKSRKPRTIQMRYPAPYSWSFTEPYDRRHMKMKKTVPSLESANDKMKLKPKSLAPCCDPYAPHLKYGIFRQKQKENNLSKINLNKSASHHQTKRESKRAQKKGQSEEPYFIIRPLQKHSMKQLSVSEVLHVDIKPHCRVTSPLRAGAHRNKNY